jgi:hypothetical protein
MSKLNEWGLAERPNQGLGAAAATTPMSPTTVGAIGAGIGAVAGGLAGTMWGKKGALLGAGVGAVAGGVGGYMYQNKQTQSQASGAPCTNSPSSVPAGPYAQVHPVAGVITLQAGETYLVSFPQTAGTQQALLAQFQVLQLTVQGAWCGPGAPSGWPSNDPNAASGLFFAVSASQATNVSGTTSVFATGGASA